MVFVAGCASTRPIIPENKSEVSPNSKSLQDTPNSSQTDQTENTSKEHPLLKSVKEDLIKWPGRLLDDTKEIFSRGDNITALLLAGGASVILHQEADKKIAEYYEKHQQLRNFRDESLNIIGHPTTHFAASSLWYFLSVQNQDDLNKERAWTMRTALTITWLTTMGLKAIRDNETPNGKNWAWPSGHTSSSFTVASVLDEFYGPKVGIPAYTIASLVAYRMIDTDDHWASDVVFGATLGWVVGHTVAGKHKKLEIAGFKVLPYIPANSEPAIGISLIKQF